MSWIPLEGIDWTVVLALLKTESLSDFDLLTFVGLENVTLLGTNEVLEGTCILVVLQGCTTQDLR